jgi:hypothetical protein
MPVAGFSRLGSELASLLQVMTLHKNGLLDIRDRVKSKTLWSVGPFSGCRNPYNLTMLASGQLVLQDRSGQILWSTNSACRGNSSCYT